MEKIADITQRIGEKDKESAADTAANKPVKTYKKSTNPIFKKLVQFKNEKLSKKFDISDLF